MNHAVHSPTRLPSLPLRKTMSEGSAQTSRTEMIFELDRLVTDDDQAVFAETRRASSVISNL